MYLVGDVGNTEVKIFLIDNKFKLKKKWTFSSKKISKKYLNSKISLSTFERSNIRKILFSSVVPEAFKSIKNYLNSKIKKTKIHELKELNFNNLIKLRVNRKQVGSDRLANAIGITSAKKKFIVIDFGTATTFDVIDGNTYLGGIIAPGVKLSLENLTNKASLIPPISLSKISKVLGKNTNEAVKSGFYWGYTGLIDNIIKLIKKQSRSHYEIVLTGGLAHLFKSSINHKTKINKDLTLEGLKRATINLIR